MAHHIRWFAQTALDHSLGAKDRDYQLVAASHPVAKGELKRKKEKELRISRRGRHGDQDG
jgi:hypothetical protein